MDSLEFSQKHDERFHKHFNAQMDDITLILKCHLMLEELLREFCAEMVPQPQHLSDSRFTFAQTLDLSKALYPADIKIGRLADLWSLVDKINRIRNLMAHSLDPDSAKLERHKFAIMNTIRSRGADTKQLGFVGCLTYVLGAFSAVLQVGVTHNRGEDIQKIPNK